SRALRAVGAPAARGGAPVRRRAARRPVVAARQPGALAPDLHRRRGPGRRHPAGGVRTMRILWVKVGGLWPLNVGGRLRSFHIIAELSRRHHVSVLTTHAPGDDPRELRAELPRCEGVASFPYTAPKRD